jgi:outer membrane protein OmpA-like peptidoglycan-associated protein
MRSQQRLTAETELGHRRGVVLGLTMAELLLLLVFCLLLASVGVLADKQKQLDAYVAAKPQPAPSAERMLQITRSELQNYTENAPAEFQHLETPITSDDWTELVRGRDVARRIRASGETLTELPAPATIIAATKLEEIARERNVDVTNLIQGLTEKQPPDAPSAQVAGHNWPPIITLGNDKFRFPLNSAELSSDFRARLQTAVAGQVRDLLQQYNVDVVEVVGHTDETPINSTQQSTLDNDAIGALNGTRPITDLKPADNAGLGLARAIAVANALKAAGLPSNVRVIPLSAAQLLLPGDQLSDGSDSNDSPQRRRIEIRVRRSTESLDQ